MTKSPQTRTRIADGWPPVTEEVIAHAKSRALEAVTDEGPWPVGERLASYYDVAGNYVGASFADLAPNEWNDITPADLHAISLMSVTIDPRSTRRLLSGPERKEVLHELKQLPDVDLLVADDAALEAMYRLHLVVKRVLGDPNAKSSNRWVSASKLCARKRRDLFPVRDREVCTLLGLLRLADARVDWVVFQALIQDTGVQRAIAALPRRRRRRPAVVSSSSTALTCASSTRPCGPMPRNACRKPPLRRSSEGARRWRLRRSPSSHCPTVCFRHVRTRYAQTQ